MTDGTAPDSSALSVQAAGAAAGSAAGGASVYSVTATRTVFDGRVMKVRVDEVVMPGGNTAKREVVGHDRAVAVVALTDDPAGGEPTVALIEQYRHPLRR